LLTLIQLSLFEESMKRCLQAFLIFSLSVLATQVGLAQERCATVQYEKLLKSKNPDRETTDQFEKWLSRKTFEQRVNSNANQIQATSTYNLPVVVHVLYNTDAQNISDEQIKSQIDVLNKDFQRLNADAASTPSEFLPSAGSIDVNFVLARQDPDGFPTTGINRVRVSQTGFVGPTVDDYKIKSYSYWPAEDYLNIWVVNFSDSYLGYAQFPVSSGLPGISSGEANDRLTDGLVVKYTAFGSIDDGNFNLTAKYNKGRTTTHEMGHFLGALRHIWGDDDGCSGIDYVDDTPNQGKATNFCPSGVLTSCGVSNMYQNYMDYTNDACMNLFTKGQVERMKVVLANSPRRTSLLTSRGLLFPGNATTDVKLLSIDSPSPVFCATSATPVITIKNQGTSIITSFSVTISASTSATQRFPNLTIGPGEERQFTLAKTTFNLGTNTLSILVSEPNGIFDNTPANNSKSLNFIVNDARDIIPLRQNFDATFSSAWTIVSQPQSISWATMATNKNQSIVYNAFSNTVLGQQSWLVSPTLDFSQYQKASLFFDFSYASRGGQADELTILSSKDCGVTYSVIEFDKLGVELSDLTSSSAWTPSIAKDWNRQFVDLSSLTGNSSVRLAFVATNGNGNNMFIDNIEFFTDNDPTPITAENPFSIYGSTREFNITFNLNERQDVRLQLFDVVGRVIADQQLPNILNQTYQSDIRLQASGVYIVRIQIGNQFYASRVMVNH